MALWIHAAYLALLAGIVATTVVGKRTQNFPAFVNGVGSLLLALFPPLVEIGASLVVTFEFTIGIELPLWIAAAGFLHMLGMLGWYDTVWWWDHVTHTVSAALIAATIYASLLTLDRTAPELGLSPLYVVSFTILFTLAIGVFWEFIELAARELGHRIDRPPVLEHYGLKDTALDLVFNGVGALIVVTLDVRVFVPITEQIPRMTWLLLILGVVGVVGGSFVLGVLLGATSSRYGA